MEILVWEESNKDLLIPLAAVCVCVCVCVCVREREGEIDILFNVSEEAVDNSNF